jgi:hypothetical protein
VLCTACGGEGPEADSEVAAIKAWNRRASHATKSADHIEDERAMVADGVVVPVASPDLREAAKQFYNLTLADPEVIIRPPNAVKQEAITKAGQCLRIALTAGVREVSKC